MKEAQANPNAADDSSREVWSMYDADRIPTGTTMARGDEFRPGELHMVVHVCIFDCGSAGVGPGSAAGLNPGSGSVAGTGSVADSGDEVRMLIQRRTDDKAGWPGMWDVTVGGSVTAGESSARGAEREVLEELGLRIDLTGTRPSFTFNFRHGFDDFYLLRATDLAPIDLGALAIPNDEVAEVRWATRAEIHALRDAGEFIPYRPSAIDFVFDMLGRNDILDLADEGGRPGTDIADFG
ncbi:NUDIX domain-containing protein [Corynebacterium xerosis]|uniref:NUDIX hydrolase n=1 Tax=Corynebacterium xerosis TaxID=1725 RepID=UPI0036585231